MAEERKPRIIHLDELASLAIEKTALPIAQFINKIKLQLQPKLNGYEPLLKLLSELEENCEFIVNIRDLDPADKAALAEVGKKLSQDLKQKVGILNKSVAALLTTSFQGIENYYNQFLSVTSHYSNQSHGLVDGKLETTVLQEPIITQAQGGYVEAKLERTQQIVSTISNNNIKKPSQSFFSVFKSEQHAQRDKLHDEETVKQKFVNRIPSHFQLGAAIGQGDCFFDAMAQSLNMMKGSNEYTAKSLRLLCDDYVKSEKHAWVKDAIEQDKDNYEQYLVRLPFTVEELEKEEKANTGLKLEDIVWGKPEVEGRMICEITKVKLHVIGVLEQPINGMEVTEQLVAPQASEPITTIEKGEYDNADIVHLVNYHNHFVPLLDTKLVQADTSLAQLTKDSHSPSHTNIPVTAPYSQNSFNNNAITAGKMQVEVKNRRTAVSMPSSLAKKKEFADMIKEKIKQEVSANPHYKLLLEKLVQPEYETEKEFIKEEMRRVLSMTSNADAHAYLNWLEKNYAKIDHRETSGRFEEEAIDLYIREERDVEIKRWNVPNIPSHFIGREHLLEQLAQRLNPKENQTSMVVLTALHGLGGIGKTFLAARYAQLYAENYTFVLWFNAESETTLMNDYRNFADTFHLPIEGESPESTLTIVKNWLEQQSNWLIIYDNAPDDQLIAKFRPATGGKVLITSRKESWNKKDSLPIDVFSLKEARAYIVELTGFSLDEHQDKIDELAKTLGNLPLALAQACAYISVNHLSLKEYLALYVESRAEMLADETMPAETSHEPVAVTWHITFEAIKKQQPAASILLESCAFLQGSSIPEFLLKELFAKQQPMLAKQSKPFIDVIRCLQQYNILKLISEKKEKAFSLHNLVQDVIFDGFSDEKKRDYLFDVINLLQKVFPVKHAEQLEDYAKQRSLLPHLEKGLQRVDEWLNQLRENSNIEEDEKHLEELITIIERELFYVPLLVLSAHGYSNLGDTRKQKALLEQALVIKKQRYGKSHPEVATILNSLAQAYGDLGDAHKQKEVLERALEIKEQHYEKNHLTIAITLNNLANAYGDLGDARKQKELLERAFPIFERDYGKDHLEVASILDNLATAYFDLGEFQQARPLLERVLEIKEQHYSGNHPSVGKTLNNLAKVCGSLGDFHRSEQLLKRALEIKEQHYGKDHPEVALALDNLANVYVALGKFQQARQLLERALPILEQHFSRNHPVVAVALKNLANTYGDVDNVQKQKGLLEYVLEIEEQYYGKAHPMVAVTLGNLADVYGGLGDAHKQKELMERALEIKEQYYGKDHSLVAISLHDLGPVCASLGDWSTAKIMAERAYQIFSIHPNTGPQHLLTQVAKERLDKINELLAIAPPEQLTLLLNEQQNAPQNTKRFSTSENVLQNLMNQQENRFTFEKGQMEKLVPLAYGKYQQAEEALRERGLTQAIHAYQETIQLAKPYQFSWLYEQLAYTSWLQALHSQDKTYIDIAEQSFNAAIEIISEPKLFILYAHYLFQRQQYSQALAYLESVTTQKIWRYAEIDFNYDEFNKGLLPHELQDEINKDRILKIDGILFAYYILIRSCLELTKKEQAQEGLETLRDKVVSKEEAFGYALLGYAYKALGNYHEAATCFMQAIELQQHYPLAEINIQKCLQLAESQQSLASIVETNQTTSNEEDNELQQALALSVQLSQTKKDDYNAINEDKDKLHIALERSLIQTEDQQNFLLQNSSQLSQHGIFASHTNFAQNNNTNTPTQEEIQLNYANALAASSIFKSEASDALLLEDRSIESYNEMTESDSEFDEGERALNKNKPNK